MAAEERKIVGRVLRASTIGFDCGTHSSQIDRQHDFGALVKAPVANSPGLTVFGLIFAVEIESDELITELVMAEGIQKVAAAALVVEQCARRLACQAGGHRG